MFDPHKSTSRKRSVSHKGQVIQCRPKTPPFTFDMKTWKKYEAWAKKNNLIPEPVTPSSDNYEIEEFDNTHNIAINMAGWSVTNILRIEFISLNRYTINPISSGGTNNSFMVNTSYTDINSNYAFMSNFSTLLYMYQTENGIVNDYINVLFIVDPIAKTGVLKIYLESTTGWYGNIDENGVTYAFSQENPARTLSQEITVVINDPLIISRYIQPSVITVNNFELDGNLMTNIPSLVFAPTTYINDYALVNYE